MLTSITGEFERYRTVGRRAMDQLTSDELCEPGPGGTPAISTIVWHITGNLTSRFTDFLESDGEKPGRNRPSEFEPRQVDGGTLRRRWDDGWGVLFGTLADLDDADLVRTVRLKGVVLPVHEALHRALAHTSYHVGQIVYRARALRGDAWEYLSIPPGEPDRPPGPAPDPLPSR